MSVTCCFYTGPMFWSVNMAALFDLIKCHTFSISYLRQSYLSRHPHDRTLLIHKMSLLLVHKLPARTFW